MVLTSPGFNLVLFQLIYLNLNEKDKHCNAVYVPVDAIIQKERVLIPVSYQWRFVVTMKDVDEICYG